jgi:rod shape-determining protein MreD
MKKKFVYSIILLIAIIVQTSVLPVISNQNILGDAVLMAVLAWSVLDGFYAFIGWAIAAGILYDLAAYSPVGEHVLIFLAVVYFVSFFSRRLSLELKGIGLALLFMFVIVAMFISKSVISLITAWEMQTLNDYWTTFGSLRFIAIQIVYNEILFFIWFVLLRKVKKFFEL